MPRLRSAVEKFLPLQRLKPAIGSQLHRLYQQRIQIAFAVATRLLVICLACGLSLASAA